MTTPLRTPRGRPRWETHAPFLSASGLAIAALLVVSSLGGLLFSSTYAAETRTWAAQAMAQDWVNLILVVPLLVVTGAFVRQRSRTALLVFAGILAYDAYNFVLYAFAVHFNAFFLVYVAILGLSAFALMTIAGSLMREDTRTWFDEPAPVRLPVAVQALTALLFGGLWLGDVLSAFASGTRPASLGDEALFTNPVQVVDLAIVLPAFLVSAVSLALRRPLGFWLAPVLLIFSTLMAVTIGIVQLYLFGIGLDASAAVAGAMFSLGAVSLLAFVRLAGAQPDRLPLAPADRAR